MQEVHECVEGDHRVCETLLVHTWDTVEILAVVLGLLYLPLILFSNKKGCNATLQPLDIFL